MSSYYKNILEQFNKLNINLYRVLVADELDCLQDNLKREISDSEFDTICSYACCYCMNSQATPNEIVNAIIKALNENEIRFGKYDLEPCDINKNIDDIVFKYIW